MGCGRDIVLDHKVVTTYRERMLHQSQSDKKKTRRQIFKRMLNISPGWPS